jgi:hypothetical protein
MEGPWNNEGFNAQENFLSAKPVSEYKRAYIDEFLIAWSVADISAYGINNMVLGVVPDATFNSTAIFGNSGTHYGLRCDGSGGIEFYSVIGSVVQEATAITWPETDYRNWVKVIMEHRCATPAGAGSLRIWLNDLTNLQVQRNWGAGTTLPDFSDVLNARRMAKYFGQRLGEPAHTMFWTMFRYRAGKFSVDGTEL